jgi:protein-disulfide isomerase/rhodanese-related sulfurtransferase
MMLALCLLGLFDSFYLLYTYTSPSRPMVCIGTGCDAVRASAYSTLGGVSMPVFGVLGYTLLTAVLIAESLFSRRAAKLARYAFLGMTGFGFLFSLYLEYLQAFVIHAYCAWCLTSGAVMTALFVLGIVNLVRSEPEPEPATQLARVRSLFAVSVAAAVVGAPAFYLLARRGEVDPPAAQVTPADLAMRLVRPGSHEAGNPRAPLTVVEFGDFECPVCGRAEAAAREVRARYAQQVRFVFRQFPLERIHPLAQKAGEASECGGEQGKFWEMVEKIYSRQDDLSLQGLQRDAAELGLDQQRFNQCLTNGAAAARVRRDVEDGRALGVRATPTFFIGQQKVEGVLSAAQFSQLIDEQLGGASVKAANVEPPAPPAVAPATPPNAAPAAGPRSVPVASPKSTVSPTIAAASNAAANPAPPPIGLPAAAPGGVAGAWQGAPSAPGMAPGGLFGSAPGGAACSEADAAKTQPTTIGTQELRQLLATNPKPLFVDVRPAGEFAAARIPGAINIPADDMARRWNTLPKDRTIVLYESGRSSGDVCAAGRAAGRTLLEHGFPFAQVNVYQDGLAGWQRAGIGMDQ